MIRAAGLLVLPAGNRTWSTWRTEPTKQKEILVRPQMSQFEVQESLRAWARKQSADVKPMGRLVRRYKTEGENMHWHISGLRRGMGTVEVTYLPSTGNLRILVHDNRRGLWAGEAYIDLANEVKRTLKQNPSAKP